VHRSHWKSLDIYKKESMITRILRAGLTAKDENTTEVAICGAPECQLPTLLETTKS
jgi:hypothetical protein